MNKLCVLQNLKNVSSEPWPHIIIENALPQEIHDELLDTLPDDRLGKQEAKDKHGKLTWLIYEMYQEKFPVSNIWKDFILYHTSQEFVDKVLNAFDTWTEKLPLPKNQMKLIDTNLPEDKTGNYYTEFSFVKHPPENNLSNRTPHTDNEKEIYAGLLYLKHPLEQSTGRDFAIHQPHSLKMTKKREYITPGPIVKKCEYKSNNFVMFWNGVDTQHSVTPRQNASHPRWSINMIGRWTGHRNWRIPN